MRLSDVLEKVELNTITQVDNFLEGKSLPSFGVQRKITIGRIAKNYFCKSCGNQRTFLSKDNNVICLGVDKNKISINATLKCSSCDEIVVVWYLIEFISYSYSTAPTLKIIKYSEYLSEHVSADNENYDEVSIFLEKAEHAYNEGLGAGCIVYLRKIYENITVKAAKAVEVNILNDNGKRKNFSKILKEVNEKSPIIPREFSDDGYKLFSELSNILHGSYDDDIGLQKYKSLKRLIIGIIENINNSRELKLAIGKLGWLRMEGENL